MPTEVLFISYFYPPLGGAGVQRSLKFVRYLPEFGFRPLVLTGTGSTEGWWEPKDPLLGKESPEDIPVFRPTGPSPSTQPPSRVQRLMGRPGAFAEWWGRQILELGPQVAARHRPALIYVTLSPYESLEPALLLARRLDLPLLVDLRDPWALDENRVYPTAWHRKREIRRMGRLFASCTRVLWNCREACRAAREAWPHLPDDLFATLPNGFDEEDFRNLDATHDDKFTLTHVGFLHAAKGLRVRHRSGWLRGLGGELWPIDFLGRSHFYLLQALARVQDRHPEWKDRWELRLVGPGSDVDIDLIDKSGLADHVTLTGYVTHERAVQELVDAQALFLPHHGLPGGNRARTVPGKVYEYLRSGRPILGALPAGDARDLTEGRHGGDAVDPDDVDGMGRWIETEMERFFSKGRVPDLDPGGLERFERRELTKRLAGEFSSLLAGDRHPTAEAGS